MHVNLLLLKGFQRAGTHCAVRLNAGLLFWTRATVVCLRPFTQPHLPVISSPNCSSRVPTQDPVAKGTLCLSERVEERGSTALYTPGAHRTRSETPVFYRNVSPVRVIALEERQVKLPALSRILRQEETHHLEDLNTPTSNLPGEPASHCGIDLTQSQKLTFFIYLENEQQRHFVRVLIAD